MKLSVVIPARNEEEVIEPLVIMLLRVFDEYIHQIIVVDDGSTDNTVMIVKKLSKKDSRVELFSRTPPHGVGRALRDGLKRVKKTATHILTLDADFTRNIPDLFPFFEKINECDGIIGSRYMEKYSLVRYPELKKFFNRSFHLLVRLLYGVNQHDLTNNFKFYKKEVFDALPLSATDYAINAETGLYPILLGYNILELPVIWFARGKNMGQSKFKLLSVAPGYIQVLRKAKNIVKNTF
jgi:dolichol-phosphate mannosyltransferase